MMHGQAEWEMDETALGSYPVAMFGAGVTGSLGYTSYQNIH